MAGSLNNPKKFTIDDAFEEGYDDAIRVYGSTTERSPLKPKEKISNVENNVTVWVESPNEQRLRNIADDTTSRDSDSLIRYNGYYSEYEYDPSEPCWKHPKIQENWKMVLAATALLIIGICLFMLGIILSVTSGIQGVVFFIAGFICFVPGAYHVVYIYFAVKGKRETVERPPSSPPTRTTAQAGTIRPVFRSDMWQWGKNCTIFPSIKLCSIALVVFIYSKSTQINSLITLNPCN